jgi:hypothetical protein
MYFFGILIPAVIIVFSGALTYNYAYDEPEKIIIGDYPEDDSGDISQLEKIYNSKLNRIKLYSIGDVVSEQELMNLTYQVDKYSIWFDVHEKKGNKCSYEMKGLHEADGDERSMDWRFYIITENNIITSIVRG